MTIVKTHLQKDLGDITSELGKTQPFPNSTNDSWLNSAKFDMMDMGRNMGQTPGTTTRDGLLKIHEHFQITK